MRVIRSSVALLALAALYGCASVYTPTYIANPETVVELRGKSGLRLNVGEFTGGGDFDAGCLAVADLRVTEQGGHAAYLAGAFKADMQIAGVFDAKAPITLSGKLNHLEFTNRWAHWKIDFTLISSNGKSIQIAETLPFRTVAFNELESCKSAAEAYMHLARRVVLVAVSHPDFALLTR